MTVKKSAESDVLTNGSSNNIKVLSANCQGLQNVQKRRDVLTYFKESKAKIVCLQDTHWTTKNLLKVKKIWGNNCFINGSRTNSRGGGGGGGVAILICDDFEFKVLNSVGDQDGKVFS